MGFRFPVPARCRDRGEAEAEAESRRVRQGARLYWFGVNVTGLVVGSGRRVFRVAGERRASASVIAPRGALLARGGTSGYERSQGVGDGRSAIAWRSSPATRCGAPGKTSGTGPGAGVMLRPPGARHDDGRGLVVGMGLVRAPQEARDVGLGHRLADVRVHDRAARHGDRSDGRLRKPITGLGLDDPAGLDEFGQGVAQGLRAHAAGAA